MKIKENGNITQEEKDECIKLLKTRLHKIEYKKSDIEEVILTPNGDYIDIDLKIKSTPFQRIRRITGYLVGTMDRFNNAKTAEVKDRVKHE